MYHHPTPPTRPRAQPPAPPTLQPLPLLATLWPWLAFPLLALWRARGSRTLDEEPAGWPGDTTVSVVVPARDEAANIARCVRSLLATPHAALDVVVVDDHSTDGTADLARAAAAGDPRLRIVSAPPLPPGWMGKQWACATGAAATQGDVLLFTDADTAHAPDLVPRALHALAARHATLLSVVGRQEMHSFWERVAHPQVLAILAARYGGTERIARSRFAFDKVANGQCLLVRRHAYDAAGGHGLVRASVSEDLMLAQRLFALGHHVAIVLAPNQTSTRMYDSLGALVRGWRKNIYAGGREAMPLGAFGRMLFPLLLLFPPLLQLVPVGYLMAALTGHATTDTVHAMSAAALLLLAWWTVVYRRLGLSPLWALTYPLGAVVLLWITVSAIARGSHVEWKGRAYTSR